MSTEPVMPSNHLILRPSLLLWLSIFPRIRVFSNESILRISWPKWRFQFLKHIIELSDISISEFVSIFCSKSDSCNSLHLVLIYFSFQSANILNLLSPPWLFLFSKSKVINCSKVLTISTFAQFSSAQSLSHASLFATPWTAACQASLSVTNSRSLLKLTSIKSVMPSSHIILSCPLLLLPLIFPSIRVFSNESILHIRWPKYWSFNFSISHSNEYSRLVSFRMDWWDVLAIQGTLKSLPIPQIESISSSVLSFLHSPTLTSIHDHWKNHSLD